MQIKKVVLDYIKVEEKISSRTGKPYTTLSVKIRGEDFYRNGFCSKKDEVALANAGDTVTLKLYEEPWDGKMMQKVGVPSMKDVVDETLKSFDQRLKAIEAKLGGTITPQSEPNEIDISNLSF